MFHGGKPAERDRFERRTMATLFIIWLTNWTLINSPEFNDPQVHAENAVVYKVGPQGPVFQPPPVFDGPRPAVILVHGGMWIVNDRNQYRDVAIGLARNGFVAVTIDFSLSPESGFEAQVADIKDSIRWLRSNAERFGVNPDRIGLFGSSSGGHLAAMAAMAGNGEGINDDPPGESSALQAAFLLYGVYEFGREPQEEPAVPSGLAEIIRDIVFEFAGAKELGEQAALAKWSPINYIDGNEPATIMVHGTDDKVAPLFIANEMADLLGTHGVSATVFSWPRRSHGFGELQPWSRPLILELMVRFYKSAL